MFKTVTRRQPFPPRPLGEGEGVRVITVTKRQLFPPRPLGEGIGVRVITMTENQINAFHRATSARRRLKYRRPPLNQSNASIRRTTGTQTPDPVLPVPTMLKPHNRNPLTIHIASHTGSEVRGEGNLIRHPSAAGGFHDADFVGVDLCVDPLITILHHPSGLRTGSITHHQSAAGGFHDGDFVGVDPCVDPVMPQRAASPPQADLSGF